MLNQGFRSEVLPYVPSSEEIKDRGWKLTERRFGADGGASAPASEKKNENENETLIVKVQVRKLKSILEEVQQERLENLIGDLMEEKSLLEGKSLLSVLEEGVRKIWGKRGYDVIDALSLDVEGMEVEILRGVDWSKIMLGLVTVEANQYGHVNSLLADCFTKSCGMDMKQLWVRGLYGKQLADDNKMKHDEISPQEGMYERVEVLVRNGLHYADVGQHISNLESLRRDAMFYQPRYWKEIFPLKSNKGGDTDHSITTQQGSIRSMKKRTILPSLAVRNNQTHAQCHIMYVRPTTMGCNLSKRDWEKRKNSTKSLPSNLRNAHSHRLARLNDPFLPRLLQYEDLMDTNIGGHFSYVNVEYRPLLRQKNGLQRLQTANRRLAASSRDFLSPNGRPSILRVHNLGVLKPPPLQDEQHYDVHLSFPKEGLSNLDLHQMSRYNYMDY